MDKTKEILLNDIDNLSTEDKQLHEKSLRELITKAKTMRELKKIQMTLDILLSRDLKTMAA